MESLETQQNQVLKQISYHEKKIQELKRQHAILNQRIVNNCVLAQRCYGCGAKAIKGDCICENCLL